MLVCPHSFPPDSASQTKLGGPPVASAIGCGGNRSRPVNNLPLKTVVEPPTPTGREQRSELRIFPRVVVPFLLGMRHGPGISFRIG